MSLDPSVTARPGPEPRTLGWLIGRVVWDEELRATQAAFKHNVLDDSAEARSRVENYRDQSRVSYEITNAPGKGRIQLLCEEMDGSAGMSAANLVKLRARVCRAKGCLPVEADQLLLDQVADALEGVPAGAGPSAGDGAGSDRPKPRQGVPGSGVELLLEEDAKAVLGIAHSKRSADVKMRDICRLDRRYLGWDSGQWAELLQVSDAAIRRTRFWKEDRRRAIEADREL
jgi:hypothetical protein